MKTFLFAELLGSKVTKSVSSSHRIWSNLLITATALVIALSFYTFEFMRLASWGLSFIAFTLATAYVRFGKFFDDYENSTMYRWKRFMFWTAVGVCIIGLTSIVCANFSLAKALMMKIGFVAFLVQIAEFILMVVTPDRAMDAAKTGNQRWRYGIRRGLLVTFIAVIAIVFAIWYGTDKLASWFWNSF